MTHEHRQMNCAHPPCKCTVPKSGDFCSEECRKVDLESGQASTSSAKCPCKHSDCG
jgi:hypothetical protein